MRVLLFITLIANGQEQLKTKIHLQPIESKNQEDYIILLKDPRVEENHTAFESKRTDTRLKQEFKYRLQETEDLFKHYAIYYEKVFVGYIYIFTDNSSPNIVYIAYSLLPKYWNKGIGTIAVEKILYALKNKLKSRGYKYIYATIKTQNIGSQKILLKNNFKYQQEENGEKKTKIINGFVSYVLELKL